MKGPSDQDPTYNLPDRARSVASAILSRETDPFEKVDLLSYSCGEAGLQFQINSPGIVYKKRVTAKVGSTDNVPIKAPQPTQLRELQHHSQPEF